MPTDRKGAEPVTFAGLPLGFQKLQIPYNTDEIPIEYQSKAFLESALSLCC